MVDADHRRRLAPEAVTRLDWHNEMSELMLDINDRVAAAADDRARGVIIRRLRRALLEENA
jgi:metallo-beta-lactamase family protein